MPRRGGFRRRSRRTNKRRRTVYNPVSISRALNAAKNYIYENRSHTISSSQNYIKYAIMPYVFNTYVPTSSTTLSIGAGPSVATIVTQAGHEASANSATDTNYKVRVYKQSVTYKIRNLSNHPTMVTLYDYISKIDNPDATTVDALIMEDLVLGWQKQMQTGQVGINADGTIVNWDETFPALPQGFCESLSSTLKPAHSYDFRTNYKMLRKVEYKMLPGDDITWHVSAPYLDVEPTHIADYSSSPALIRNKTKFTMIRLHGCMGKSTTSDAVVGYMQTDLSIEVLGRAKSYRIRSTERSIPMEVPVADPMAGVTLEGPSDFTHAAENQ